jgi:hypothetical protein
MVRFLVASCFVSESALLVGEGVVFCGVASLQADLATLPLQKGCVVFYNLR